MTVKMKKTYRRIGLYFSWGSALQNEFHDLGESDTFEAAEEAITEEELERYDLVLIVPAYQSEE